MTSSNGNIFRVTGHLCGEFTGPAQRPVTRSFYVFFDLRLNKRLSKQSWDWWFETLPGPLWRHSNVLRQPQDSWLLIILDWGLWSILYSFLHYGDVTMGMMASQITSLTIFNSTVYLGADQRKHQSSASLAFVWGIHWGPVNSPHKRPVPRKMFPFDDVIVV